MKLMRIRGRRQAISKSVCVKPIKNLILPSQEVSKDGILDKTAEEFNAINTPSSSEKSSRNANFEHKSLDNYLSGLAVGNQKTLPPVRFKIRSKQEIFQNSLKITLTDRRKYREDCTSFRPERCDTPSISYRSYRGNNRKRLLLPHIVQKKQVLPITKRTHSIQDYIVSSFGSRIRNDPINILKYK